MMRTPSKCSLKGELWSRQQLNASLEQFSAIFERRPKSNNAGGGGLNHAFALWHTLHTLQPKAVIESGVLYGQGTWLARQALGPDALIHALDPCDFDAKRSGNWIDPNPRTKYWRGSRFTDLGSINWTAIIPDRSVRQSTLVILDDHMSAIKRIAQLIPHDFQHVWYDDNWNGRAMDCYSFNAICSPVARGDSNTSMNASLDYFDNFKKVRFRIPLAEHFANLQFLLGHLQDYFEYPTLFGSPACTAPVLAFGEEAAAAIGEDPGQFDSYLLGIRGATDLHHLFGGADAESFIQKRGRWCSMVHQIYFRMSASMSMSVSAQMHEADGVDMEAFCLGYVMPALSAEVSALVCGPEAVSALICGPEAVSALICGPEAEAQVPDPDARLCLACPLLESKAG
ncbi:MAG: hypothetical protein SGPRY_003249, partial [Prymnesium sp.]